MEGGEFQMYYDRKSSWYTARVGRPGVKSGLLYKHGLNVQMVVMRKSFLAITYKTQNLLSYSKGPPFNCLFAI